MGDSSGQHAIRLFQSLEHPCGYWPDRLARDLVIDPTDPHLPTVYGQALVMGFRRSGGHVYRPHCVACRACIPVRIPAARFEPNRSQKRCLARNADLELRIAPPVRTGENFALYRRYLDTRHAGGGMDDPAPENFDAFLAGFPIDDPQFVVLVVIDEPEAEKPGMGATAGLNAAPMVGAVIRRSAALLGVKPRTKAPDGAILVSN